MLNLHSILHASRANGPGQRTVIWFQGCDLGCPGCYNPQTHSPSPRELVEVEQLVGQILEAEGADGVTISGGEPFQQPAALLELVSKIRQRSDLSILVFSGYTLEEIRGLDRGAEILAHIDVLVAGRYVESRHVGRGLLGSSNQRIHRLTERHTVDELDRTPRTEVRIGRDGEVRVTGIGPIEM